MFRDPREKRWIGPQGDLEGGQDGQRDGHGGLTVGPRMARLLGETEFLAKGTNKKVSYAQMPGNSPAAVQSVHTLNRRAGEAQPLLTVFAKDMPAGQDPLIYWGADAHNATSEDHPDQQSKDLYRRCRGIRADNAGLGNHRLRVKPISGL